MRFVLHSSITHPFVCSHLVPSDSACRISWHKIPGMTSLTAWASPQVVITAANVPSVPTLRVEVDSKAGEWHRRYHDLEASLFQVQAELSSATGSNRWGKSKCLISIWKIGDWLISRLMLPMIVGLKPKGQRKRAVSDCAQLGAGTTTRVVAVLWRGRCKMRGRSCQNVTGKGIDVWWEWCFAMICNDMHICIHTYLYNMYVEMFINNYLAYLQAHIYIYVPGSRFAQPPPNGMVPQEPPPASSYLLRTSTYYLLFPTTYILLTTYYYVLLPTTNY